jgi:magnesium chelatase family protein
VTNSRAQGTLTSPANFMLIAARNPCLCGYFSDPARELTCTMATITRYQKRISGPLLDRIDYCRQALYRIPAGRGARSVANRVGEADRPAAGGVIGQHPLSARAFPRILKLARAITDVEGAGDIATQHLAEAIQYRPRKET